MGFTPGWVHDAGQAVKPRELFGQQSVKACHFFSERPGTRALWVFQTNPIAQIFQSPEAILFQAEPPPGTVYTPFAVIVFDDYSTAD